MTSEAAPTPAPPRLLVEHLDGHIRISFPQGKIDGNGVREMYEAAAQILNQRGPKMLVDFTGVGMVTSATMGMLVTIKKKCLSAGAQLHIAIPDSRVMQQMQIMNLHRILNLFPTPQEAVQFKK
jgi:anti-anti-sigma factor